MDRFPVTTVYRLPYHTHNVSVLRIDRAFREILLSDDCRSPEYYSPGALQPAPLRNPVTYQNEVPAHKLFGCRIPDARKPMRRKSNHAGNANARRQMHWPRIRPKKYIRVLHHGRSLARRDRPAQIHLGPLPVDERQSGSGGPAPNVYPFDISSDKDPCELLAFPSV